MPLKVAQIKDYQDALYRILLYISSTEGLPVFKKAEELKIDDSIDLLSELINKHTPKKVKMVYEDDWDEFGNRMIFEECCPICNEDISDVGGAYCHSCGQALDWNVEDE